ncbi:MAG: KAP family P-loop domain protein [Elusimicrobia bacterium ADurb.Bin231]|nr:MAG: KAP family P-loop domain protein [Elusimicrobia bacterium ADurb.Bin231]
MNNDYLLTDGPLENPEDDKLGYEPFAKNLASTICKIPDTDGIVFSLNGSWGTGKTTCINFILHYIEKQENGKKPIIIRFNPWWFTGKEDLLKQFFKEFLVVLNKDKEKFKDTMKLLADFVEIVSELPEPTGAVRTAGKLSALLLKRAAKNNEAWKIREEIKNAIKKHKTNFLVIIDDIDRLDPQECKEIFMLVKAVADFPNTTYLLSFDKKIVTSVLEPDGDCYLEKIVQVPFDLPLPDSTAIRTYFLKQLNNIFSNTKEELIDKTYFGNVFWDGIAPILNSIRDAKRLLNAIIVNYTSLENEVNPSDFMAIEAIRVFFPNIFYFIRENQDYFDAKEYSKELLQNVYKEVLNNEPPEQRKIVIRLLSRIFPKFKSVYDNINYGYSWENIWEKELRICATKRFPIYFRLSIPSGEISSTEMDTILQLTNDEKSFSNKLLELSKQKKPDGMTRVSSLLERLGNYDEQKIPTENVPNILSAIYQVGDDLLLPEDEIVDCISIGNDRRIAIIVFRLLKIYGTQDERFGILKDVFTKGNALACIVSKVTSLGQQHGKYSNTPEPEADCLIALPHVTKLEKIALDKIHNAVNNACLLNTPKLAHTLYRWRDWENISTVKKWIDEIIKSDEGLVKILTSFVIKVHSHTMTDRVMKAKWRIDLNSISPFINPDNIIDRSKQIIKLSPKWLNQDGKNAIEVFIKFYEGSKQGKSIHSIEDDE